MIWRRMFMGPLLDEAAVPLGGGDAAAEDVIDEIDNGIDDLEEMLAVHSIVSEERHEEILGGVAECRESLTVIQNQLQSPTNQSPSMELLLERTQAIMERLTALETEIRSLRPSPNPAPSSNPEQPPSEPQSPEDAAALPAAKPEEEAVRPPSKRKRFRLI